MLRSPRPSLVAALRRTLRTGAALAGLAVAPRATAGAQAVIKVNDTVSVRFGVLLQPWFNESQDPVSGNYAQNIYLRRMRLLVGGQVTSQFGFFFDTDDPNLGRTQGAAGKTIASGFILQDAYVDYHPSRVFTVQAGLMFPPSARNALETAAGLLPVDYGSYSFINQSAAIENEVNGRDLGVQAKGYLLGNRLEYRGGVFQGRRDAATAGLGATNALRTAGRLQYAFLDPEVVPFFYPGLYLGRKRMLNIGVSFDAQQTLRTYTADLFFDHPVGGGGAFTVQGDVFRRDGGSKFPALPRQTDAYVEAGYLFTGPGFMPFGRYEARSIDGSSAASERRFQAGLTYFIAGQNVNLKAAYGQVRPTTGPNTNEFTAQLQLFYY